MNCDFVVYLVVYLLICSIMAHLRLIWTSIFTNCLLNPHIVTYLTAAICVTYNLHKPEQNLRNFCRKSGHN